MQPLPAALSTRTHHGLSWSWAGPPTVLGWALLPVWASEHGEGSALPWEPAPDIPEVNPLAPGIGKMAQPSPRHWSSAKQPSPLIFTGSPSFCKVALGRVRGRGKSPGPPTPPHTCPSLALSQGEELLGRRGTPLHREPRKASWKRRTSGSLPCEVLPILRGGIPQPPGIFSRPQTVLATLSQPECTAGPSPLSELVLVLQAPVPHLA